MDGPTSRGQTIGLIYQGGSQSGIGWGGQNGKKKKKKKVGVVGKNVNNGHGPYLRGAWPKQPVT